MSWSHCQRTNRSRPPRRCSVRRPRRQRTKGIAHIQSPDSGSVGDYNAELRKSPLVCLSRRWRHAAPCRGPSSGLPTDPTDARAGPGLHSSGRSICCFPESSLVVQEPCLLHSHRHHANVTAPCTVGGFNLLISNMQLLFLGVSMNEQKLARVFLNRSSQSLGRTPRFLGESPGIDPPIGFRSLRVSVVSSTTEEPAPARCQMSHRSSVSPAVSSCRLCL